MPARRTGKLTSKWTKVGEFPDLPTISADAMGTPIR
jgi:hypothetical protein